MNQEDIVNSLSKAFGLPKSLSEKILKHFLSLIAKETKRGNNVKLRNFGTFEARFSYGKRRVKFDDSKNIFKHYGQEI